MAEQMKEPRKFFDMDSAERFADLRERVNKFNMLQLPGQSMSMHMGTSYLVDDLWRELQRQKGAPAVDRDLAGMIDTRVPLSQLSPTALVTMPIVAELEQRIVALEHRFTKAK